MKTTFDSPMYKTSFGQFLNRELGEAYLVGQGFEHDAFGWSKLEEDAILGDWQHEVVTVQSTAGFGVEIHSHRL